MATPPLAVADDFSRDFPAQRTDRRPLPHAGPGLQADAARAPASAVSWGAIVAGAAAAAALSLILLILGAGLGLSAVSPWADSGSAAARLGVAAIVWLSFTQLMASGLGGYIAGRLRSRWANTASDEVYFRDTAHGFLAWAVASLATAALLGSAIGGIVGTSARTGAALLGDTAAATTATTAAAATTANTATTATTAPAAAAAPAAPRTGDAPLDYAVESLFRADPAAPATAPTPSTPAPLAEVTHILANGLHNGSLPDADLHHVAALVAQRTGLPQDQAERRVAELQARLQTAARDAQTAAREAADRARQASMLTALWTFVSLLVGAFAASLAATFGGRQRDA